MTNTTYSKLTSRLENAMKPINYYGKTYSMQNGKLVVCKGENDYGMMIWETVKVK